MLGQMPREPDQNADHGKQLLRLEAIGIEPDLTTFLFGEIGLVPPLQRAREPVDLIET